MTEEFRITLSDLQYLEVDWRTGGIADPIGQIYNAVVVTLENAFAAAVSGFETAVSSVVNTANAAIRNSISSVSGGITQIISIVQGLPNTLTIAISGLTTQIARNLSSLASSISLVITQVSSAVSSGFISVISSLNSSFSNLSNTVTNTLKGVVSQITNVINPLINTVQGTLSGIGSIVGAVGSQLSSAINTGFNTFVSSLNNSLKGFVDFFNPYVAKIVDIWNWIKSFKLPDFSSLIAFIEAFGADPIGTIRTEFNNVLSDFGIPTLEEIKAMLPTLDNIKKAIFGDIDLTQISGFISSASNFFTAGQAHHSPTGFDDFWNFFSTVVQLFSTSGVLGTFFQTEAWKGILTGKGLTSTIQTDSNFFKPLTDFLTSMWTMIQQDSAPIIKGLQTFFGSLVTAAIKASELPTPDKTITDPFEMIGDSMQQEFKFIAGMVTTKGVITDASATKTTEEVLAVIGLTEALEFGALAVEALHPTKKLQFMDKLKRSFSKIGLGKVTGILGGALVGVSLSPFFRRYFNKLAQVQLISPNELIQMNHRNIMSDKDLDEFLQEHGLNDQFRTGVIELAHPLIGYMTAASAYFRAIAFEGFDATAALTELMELMTMEGVSDTKRKGFTFSDTDLLKKIVYSLPNIRVLRSMWMVGEFDVGEIEDIFTASGLMPVYVKRAAEAVILQGQLPYLKAQEQAFMSKVRHGFETTVTFTELLKKIGYPSTFITPTVAAAQIQTDEEVNILQVSEYDKQYTEGFMIEADYVKNVKPLFKNDAIYTIHKAIADLAVKRLTNTRIRTASDRAISEELAAFATGAVSAKEFETICKAANKTPEEITALEQARQIIYKNLVRTVKFRNYQSALGKGNITPSQFKTLSADLPIDADIVSATEQHIILAMVKAAKISPADANALLADAGIPLITGS